MLIKFTKKNKKYIIIEKCVLCLREGDPDL